MNCAIFPLCKMRFLWYNSKNEQDVIDNGMVF